MRKGKKTRKMKREKNRKKVNPREGLKGMDSLLKPLIHVHFPLV